MYIYPNNLKAKPKLWLWEQRDIGIVGVCLLLFAFVLTQGMGTLLLVATVLFALLSIRVVEYCVLDHTSRIAIFT